MIKTFIQEFKEFAVRGNVIDLAVGVIIGGAFGKITASLVSDVITPLLGLLIGNFDFKTISIGPVMIGNFIDASISFVIIALVIFCMVKAINVLKKKMAKEEVKAAAIAVPTKQEILLTEIRDLLKQGK